MTKDYTLTHSIAPLIRAMAMLANAAGCAASYTEQQPDAAMAKQLRGAALRSECILRASGLRIDGINPRWLPVLGFQIATTGIGTDIRLVPLVLTPLIKEDTRLYALRDGRPVLGQDIAYDTIVDGCIPYGLRADTAIAKAEQVEGNGTEV